MFKRQTSSVKTGQMREGADPAASMSISGYLSASDAFDITEAPQYYDVFMDPLGSSYQESDLQAPVYGQPSFSPVSVPFSTYGPPGAPVCSPPYPYGHQCLEYPCDPEMEPQNPLRGSLLGLPVIKRPRMGPGARVKGQDELCVVCGDKASGYHYNALTCEGCKGFFRRSVTKKAVYRCKSGGSCEMDMYMRRKCQDCRLRKCRAVGMLAECLLTEVQCQSKRLRKGSKYQDLSESRSVSSSSRFSTQVWSGFSREQRCFLNRIVEAYRRCVTQDDTLHRVPLCWGVASSVDLTPAQMEKLQQFLRSVPGFELLESCDQITLLCCSSVEVMFLLLAQQFSHNPAAVGAALYPTHLNDTNVDWMKTFESKLGHRILTHSGLKDELLGCVLHFLHTMFALGVTEAEYALLTATAVLCSDRPSLRAVGSVENLQELVLELLSRLCCGGGQRDPRRFARLLGRLTELRTLRHNHLTHQPPWDAQTNQQQVQ